MELHPAGWSMSASVNLPLHHKDQTFSYGASSPRWAQKKGRKTVVVVVDRIVLKVRLMEEQKPQSTYTKSSKITACFCSTLQIKCIALSEIRK